MQEDQLKLLESRINNAIVFIENLRSREKNLIQENEELCQKIVTHEEIVAEKEEKIEELKGSQEFLREKIEAILGKLESFANIDTEKQFSLKNYPEQEETESLTGEEMPGEQTEEIIIEENIVDLKDDFSLLEPDETVTKGEEVPSDEEAIQDEAAQAGEAIPGDEAAPPGEEILSEESEKPVDLSGDAQKKDENLLFTIENDIDSENLRPVDEGKKNKKTGEGSYNKKWFDNNPFIET